jgi:hypothetical protein
VSGSSGVLCEGLSGLAPEPFGTDEVVREPMEVIWVFGIGAVQADAGSGGVEQRLVAEVKGDMIDEAGGVHEEECIPGKKGFPDTGQDEVAAEVLLLGIARQVNAEHSERELYEGGAVDSRAAVFAAELIRCMEEGPSKADGVLHSGRRISGWMADGLR